MKKFSSILKSFSIFILALVTSAAFMSGVFVGTAKADDTEKVHVVGDYTFRFYYDGDIATSIWLIGYSGNAEELILPASFEFEGKTYPLEGGEMVLGDEVFAGKTNIKKVAVPDGYIAISSRAFYQCVNLEEAAIADSVEYISSDAFAGCPKVTTYRISGKNLMQAEGTGIGVDESGTPYQNVTVHTNEGSKVDDYIKDLNKNNEGGNQIKTVYEADPYSNHTVKPTDQGTPSDGSGSGNENGSSERINQMGEDNTPLGKGASEEAADKALTRYSSESDPAGSVFEGIEAGGASATAKSVTLKWKKVKGTKKYVIYGNACGKKNKMLKLKTVNAKKTKITFKKILKTPVKKGKYYKFIVIAVDKKGDVLKTSKSIHIATSGGKVGNDKAVKTKAKKNKVTLKVKKKFSLKAKAVPASTKLKVKRHRGLKYESTNKKIAVVNAKGVITAKKKGTCYVYAYAQNGKFAKIKVIVK